MRRDQEKLDRARIRAINRQHRMWGRRGGRQVEVTAATAQPAQLSSEPAIGDKVLETAGAPDQGQLSAASARPALRSAGGAEAGLGDLDRDRNRDRERDFSFGFGEKDKDSEADRPHTIDLTAEDDTLTIPRLDSLEEKLAQIERAFG